MTKCVKTTENIGPQNIVMKVNSSIEISPHYKMQICYCALWYFPSETCSCGFVPQIKQATNQLP
jgi:hypothetical protein